MTSTKQPAARNSDATLLIDFKIMAMRALKAEHAANNKRIPASMRAADRQIFEEVLALQVGAINRAIDAAKEFA